MDKYSVNVVWSYSWVESVEVEAENIQAAVDKVDAMDLTPNGPDMTDIPNGASWEIDEFQDANL